MTFTEFLSTVFTGTNLALLGAVLAVAFSGFGSARGVGMVSEASAGLLTEDPTKFGKAMVLQALPATQGIYGFVIAFLIAVVKLDIMSGSPVTLTVGQGMYLFCAALPIALGGWVSAIKQARVATAGISVLAKRPEAVGKAIISAALVEMYAILAFLISILLVHSFNPGAAA